MIPPVRRGQKMMSATMQNRIIDGANIALAMEHGKSLESYRGQISTDIIQVRNNVGSAISMGAVLEITSRLFTDPLGPLTNWYGASTPSGTDIPFGVAVNPAPDGEIAPLQVSGVVIASVTVSDADHRFAGPTAASLSLLSAESGPCEILWKPTGTGTALCLVRFMGSGGAGEKLIRFAMTSHLSLAGKATAIEITSGLAYTTVGTEFPIKDPWHDPGSWRDDTAAGEVLGSYMGWCLIPDNPELADDEFEGGAFEDQPFREIIWMEQIATYVNFTATSATTTGGDPEDPWTITATIDEWYQGKNPAAAFASFTIYDPQQLFPYIMECSRGKARYNEKEHRYEIVAVNQMALLATATLGSDMCSDNGATLTDVVAASFSPFGMTPDVDAAANPLELCGITGAKVWIAFNNQWGNECNEEGAADGRWEVIQVEHRAISVIIDHRIVDAGECCQHQIKRATLCVMSCDEIESIGWEIVPGPTDCCQEEIVPGCCGCPDAPLSGTSVLDLTFTGAVAGTLTLTQTPGGCVSWTGTASGLTGACSGELQGMQVTITCQDNSSTPIRITITGGGAECAPRTGSFDPDTYDCGNGSTTGLTGEFTVPTRDITSGDPLTPCGCGANIFVSFEERVP